MLLCRSNVLGKRVIWAVPVITSILILGGLGLSHNAYAPSFDEVTKLTASDAAAGDRFGHSISISGDTAIVGSVFDDGAFSDSGSAYVFDLIPITNACDALNKENNAEQEGKAQGKDIAKNNLCN